MCVNSNLNTLAREKGKWKGLMKIPRQSPMRQIRKRCIECCNRSTKFVRFCASIDCPLWFFRFGKFPKSYVRINDERSWQLFDKRNFEEGGKFCPSEITSSYKL